MEINTAFRILEIEHTKNENIISEAYRQLLPKYNPEDDAEGFKNLRSAYETALGYARTTESSDEDEPKTEIDIWMKKVKTLYQDITVRGDAGRWKELLDDAVCVDLDTSIDTRNAILTFLMEYHYLPHEVWKEIDNTFQIVADIAELKEEFPSDFLDYVKYNSENESFLPYELFEYISLDGENGQPDTYIRELFDIKRKIDENRCDKCLEELDNLKDYDVYHPYEDIERLKVYIKELEQEKTDNKEETENKCRFLIDKLSELPAKYTYVYTYIGDAMWCLGQKEEAHTIWENVLEECPDAYRAKYFVARYLYDKGLCEEAGKVVEELSQINSSDEALRNLLIKINDVLIEKYKKQLENGEENAEHPGQELMLELGWKLWQNEHVDEAIRLIESFSPDEKCEYGYNNLFGRLLCHNKEYERALPYLQRWKELLWKLDDVEPEEKEKRLKRRPLACCYMAGVLTELGDAKEAEENIKQAIELADTLSDKLQYMQQYAGILLKLKRYNDAVDVCDEIIENDNQYYPAYLVHQEACFELKKGQEVIDDYYMATRIVAEYYRPYMYAALVYYYAGQYQDGIDVLDKAKECNVNFTLKMKFIEEQLLRHIAQEEHERDELFVKLDDIEEHLKSNEPEESDESDEAEALSIDEIYCERALLYMDNQDYIKACIEINKAIGECHDNPRYYLIKGDILSDDNNYKNDTRFKEAADSYKSAIKYGMNDNPWLYYSLGYCYERLRQMDEAVIYYKKALDIRDTYENICERLVDYYLKKYMNTHDKHYLDEAMSYADREVNAEESSYSLWLKGKIYEYGPDFDKAIEIYNKALENDSENFLIWNQLGNCYRRLRNFEQAIICFENSIKNLNGRKRPQPFTNLAICYESIEEYEKAIDYYKQALELSEYKEGLWEDIGDCYLYLERYDDAMDAYSKADADNMDTNHADLLFAQGNYKQAEHIYKRNASKASEENWCDRYCSLGDFYMERMHNYKKALLCYNKAKNKKCSIDKLMQIYVSIIEACYISGNHKKAKHYSELALDAFKQHYDVSEEEYLDAAQYRAIELSRFGWIYIGLDMPQKAEQYFRLMEEVPLCRNCTYKACFESRLYIGIMYLVQGKTDEARKAFEEALRRNPHSQTVKQMLKEVNK
ncbi:MAG: tetratricopeptide repeat protein [Coprococcus sp.]